MAITGIYIRSMKNAPTRYIPSSFLLKGGTMDVELSGDTVTLGSQPAAQPSGNIYEQALEEFLENTHYVSKINNVPAPSGNFLLTTDQCSAWTPNGNSITLTDVCPACESCSSFIALRKQLEWLLIGLNYHKDASLYSPDDLSTRHEYLVDQRLPVSEALPTQYAKYLLDNKPSSMPPYTILFGNYLTMVQMWNYVVSQNNSSNELQTTPEDTSGICIRTKRDLPACEKSNATLTCTIEIEGSDIQPDLSLAFIGFEVAFEPFKENNDFDKLPRVTPISATSYRVDTAELPAKISGTYMVTAKFIPFFYVTMTDVDGNPVNMSDIDWQTALETETDTETDTVTETLKLGANMSDVVPKVNTNTTDYSNSKTFPSYAEQGLNRWHIRITWRMQNLYEPYDGQDSGQDAGVWVDEYYFEATKCRKPLYGLIRDSEWSVEEG